MRETEREGEGESEMMGKTQLEKSLAILQISIFRVSTFRQPQVSLPAIPATTTTIPASLPRRLTSLFSQAGLFKCPFLELSTNACHVTSPAVTHSKLTQSLSPRTLVT